MPPKPKCTREQIVDVAFALAREGGMDSVVAREVGVRLGTTATPIFTFFSTMDELKQAVYRRTLEDFTAYLGEARSYTPAFKELGLRFVEYAVHNPHLYRLLFSDHFPYRENENSVADEIMAVAEPMLEESERTFRLPKEDTVDLLEKMLIFTSGLITKFLHAPAGYSREKIGECLSEIFLGQVLFRQSRHGTFSLTQAEEMAKVFSALPTRKESNDADH